MYLDQFQRRLIQLGFVSASELKPCDESEVAALEAQLGLRFPAAYREYLLLMGHGAGMFLAGSNCFYEDVVQIQQWGRELLEDNGVEQRLPDDALVVWMHQGYQFAWLRSSEGEDPPVYYYHEAKPETFSLPQDAASFSGFLLQYLENDAEILRQIEDIRRGRDG